MYAIREFGIGIAVFGAKVRKAAVLPALVCMVAGLLSAVPVQAASFSIATGEQVILDMGTPDRFRTNFDSTTQEVDSISNGNCTLDPGIESTLMTITPSTGTVGFKAGNKNDWLGLNSGGGGIPCARVGIEQWIDFALMNESGEALEGRTFVQVDVSFNMKKNAQVRVDIALGGTAGATYTVYSGSNIPAPADLGDQDIVCGDAAGSDSGNDSQSVNCEASFLGEGDQIRFTAEDGEFSIGGRNSQTVWHLSREFEQTGVLNCDQSTAIVDGGVNEFGDFSDVTLQCHRMANLAALNTSGGCEVVPYNLEVNCADSSDPLTACSGSLFYATESVDPGNYEKFQFVCEMYTPPFLAAFDATGKYETPAIQQYFGPSDSRGVDQDFCQGVTPHFKSGTEPLVFGADGNITTNPNVLSPLLSSYESFDVPAGLDHCPDGTCGVLGQQIGCTIDRRHFQVVDQVVDSVVQTWVVEFFRWYLRGDYRAALTR